VPEPRTITVHILGNEYRIRSTEDGEFVREVALYVDDLMHRIASRMSAGTQAQVAVLAALNIAEELFRERRNGSGADPEEIDDRVRALCSRVEEIIEISDEGKTARRKARAGSARGD
jgi:cell division protein ZapA